MEDFGESISPSPGILNGANYSLLNTLWQTNNLQFSRKSAQLFFFFYLNKLNIYVWPLKLHNGMEVPTFWNLLVKVDDFTYLNSIFDPL